MSYRNLRLKKLNEIANNFMNKQQEIINCNKKSPVANKQKGELHLQNDVAPDDKRINIDDFRDELQPKQHELDARNVEQQTKSVQELEAEKNAELKRTIDEKWNEFYPNLTNKRYRRNSNGK